MFPSKNVLLLLTPALLLSGCGTTNRGLESIHQPVVERNDYVFDVATAGDGLAPGEAGRLAGWLASLRLGYGDRIAIDDPENSGAARDAVAAQTGRYGLSISDQAPVTVGTVAPGTARVIVSRMRASVPGCPDHSRTSGLDLNANTNSNFGCATNANHAAMVARPEDLVLGQAGTGTVDPAVSFKAVDTMRRSIPTGTGNNLRADSTRGGR